MMVSATDLEKNDLARDHCFERFGIIAALDYLARNAPIDQISVSTICEQAQISRTSFYRLFSDKYDAANWCMCCALEVGNKQTGRNYTWRDGNIVTLSGCLIMRDLMVGAWSSPGRHAMKETGIRHRRQDLIDSVVDWKYADLTDQLLFEIDSFAYLESYMVRTWIASKELRSVEEMAAYIEDCVPRHLHDLLSEPVDPKPGEALTTSSMIMAIMQ